jgi:hypothetical protein
MEKENKIKEIIKDIRQTVEDMNLEEPYRSIVFRAILEKQLGGIGLIETHEMTAAIESASSQIPFASFIKDKNLQTHEERALSIAYFLWKFENRNFTYSDILRFCNKVAWPTYSNPGVLIRQLKSKGYIEPLTENSKGEMEYRIIQPGIDTIEKVSKVNNS